MAIDWLTIKTEYINSNISQRDLAEKYGVSYNTLCKKATKEKWAEQRKKEYSKITAKLQQKTVEKIVKKEANKIEKLSSLVDELLVKTEIAVTQLDKSVEPVKLINGELEKEPVVVQSAVDLKGLVQISTTLKNLKEVISFTGEGDEEEDTDAYFEEAGLLVRDEKENKET